jgi:hypothetical protein
MKSFVLTTFLAAVAASAAKEESCRLWLAPSHISSKDHLKTGLFAGAAFDKDDLLPAAGELAVPLVDFLNGPAADASELNRDVIDYLETMMWTADFAGSKWEGNKSSTVFIPGYGVLANYHPGISNMDWVQAAVLLREPDEYLTRIKGKDDVSRAAVTQYYNLTGRATEPVKPGMELFASYGDSWDTAADEDEYQEKVTRKDYANADKVLQKILDYFDKFGSDMSDQLKDAVLDFMLDTVLEAAEPKRAKVIRSLIPAHPGKLQRVKEAGGTFQYRNRDLVKSPEWLEKHGMCVDNLRVGPSTIPDAGRGAFATRSFKKGDVVSPVPMVPILQEEVLEMFETVEVYDEKLRKTVRKHDGSKPIGYQLLYNYCFGHPESSLLLVPGAPMVNFVNHASKDQANVKLEWSEHEHIGTDQVLQETTLDAWSVSETPHIMFNLVATGKISPGDELFLDYGENWAEAWKEHKKTWKSSDDSKSPLRAVDTRSLYKDSPYPTDIKQGKNPYPEGVVTACFIDTTEEVRDGEPRRNERDQEILKWHGPHTYNEIAGSHLQICDVVSREQVEESGVKSYKYTVLTKIKDGPKSRSVQVKNVPHAAITLVDRPYTTDMHASNAFRHWIGIDDHLFPQAWRNLRE